MDQNTNMKKEDYEHDMEKLENEVLEGMGENPFRTYKVEFPYQVRFVLDDDENTEIIINTKSQEFYHSRTKKDVLLMKELGDSHSHISLPKYIINYLNQNLLTVSPENCQLTFTGKPVVTEMTEEELWDFQRQIISLNE